MSKNFFQNGKWIDTPHTVTVIQCACGNKYLRTRALQITCLTCIKALAAK